MKPTEKQFLSFIKSMKESNIPTWKTTRDQILFKESRYTEEFITQIKKL